MINLIPPTGQRVIKREYILHVVATLSFLFGCVALVLTIASFSIHILINGQKYALTLATEKERGEGDTLAAVEEEIRDTKEVLVQLGNAHDSVVPSEILRALDEGAPAGITFKSFSLTEKEGVVKELQVQGIATTRETLIRFKNAIEAHELFISAEVPIADLARDVDLPFTMTITLQEKK